MGTVVEQQLELSAAQQAFQELLEDLSQEILGQQDLLKRILIALLAEGHLLVVGAPGLAKTSAIKALAKRLEGSFHRVQFTPDLLPADLTGTDIYRPQSGDFEFQAGPLFHNFLLADEINRAPAKVQSALLEAMAEAQITVGRSTYPLQELFLVMATQNPIEQEGTYPLPEAQLDRFLMEVQIAYPSRETEQQILQNVRAQRKNSARQASDYRPLSQSILFEARQQVLDLHIAKSIERYIVELVTATRDPGPYDLELKQWLRYGASPRASIALEHCARAHAWLAGRDYISPADVQAVLADVLRHRLILSYDGVAQEISVEDCIERLAKVVAVP